MPAHTAANTTKADTADLRRRSLVGGVERSAGETVDRDVVNLPVLRLHQQCSAVPTDKIDGVVAGVEDRRNLEDATREGWRNQFEIGTSMRTHRCLPAYRRERYSVSQSTGAWRRADADDVSL